MTNKPETTTGVPGETAETIQRRRVIIEARLKDLERELLYAVDRVEGTARRFGEVITTQAEMPYKLAVLDNLVYAMEPVQRYRDESRRLIRDLAAMDGLSVIASPDSGE